MSLMHACFHLNRRLEGGLGLRFRRWSNLFVIINLFLVTIGLILLMYVIPGMIITAKPASLAFNTVVEVVTGGWLNNYRLHPWMWLAPILCYVMLILAGLIKGKNASLAYWCSALAIASILCSAALALFPFIVPSNWVGEAGFGSQSLTVWNVSSSAYSLMGMLYITVASMLVIIAYKLWGFKAAWRGKARLSKADLEKNDHTFY
jgi:cytochrome d ubiquinol oxidase subunit II